MTEVLNDAQSTCPVHTTDAEPSPPDTRFSEDGYESHASGVKGAHEYEPWVRIR